MKIVTVLGARPQFIKASTVSRALKNFSEIVEILVHTGQHYDSNMSDIFFSELGIAPPAYHLGVSGGMHGEMTGRQMEKIEQVLVDEKPDLVLVYGDTNSTLAGSLAAVKLHIPVAHVEAGLRSFNRRMPEEINRVVTDHISDFLFTPTETADRNLAVEGINETNIYQTGDVMYDAALYFGELAQKKSNAVSTLGLEAGGYVLATVHRAENTDDASRLKIIFNALLTLSAQRTIVMPLHPRTEKCLKTIGMYEQVKEGLLLIDPVGYLDMVALEKNAQLIITDSGGVQKEAFFYQVPCITLRDETEWVELVHSGWNRLAPPNDEETILDAVAAAAKGRPVESQQPYGDGHSAVAIADILRKQC